MTAVSRGSGRRVDFSSLEGESNSVPGRGANRFLAGRGIWFPRIRFPPPYRGRGTLIRSGAQIPLHRQVLELLSLFAGESKSEKGRVIRANI